MKDGPFPATRISAIVAASSPDQATRRRGLQAVAAAYRPPAYKYIRLRWNREPDEAEDLVQGFFAEAIEKNYFARYEPGRARFRTYLRTCLDGYVANQAKAAKRIKRGGEATIVSLEFDDAERQIAGVAIADNEAEAYFDREFARSLFSIAVAKLTERYNEAGKALHLALFERYVLADERPPGYRELAEHYAIAVTDVTNHLAAARRDFRRILLDTLRDLTATEEEFRDEARALLGVEPS